MVADAAHEAAGVLEHLAIGLGDDHGGVADGGGRMVLQHDATADHEHGIGVGIGVDGEDPLLGVLAGDELLDDQALVIA